MHTRSTTNQPTQHTHTHTDSASLAGTYSNDAVAVFVEDVTVCQDHRESIRCTTAQTGIPKQIQ